VRLFTVTTALGVGAVLVMATGVGVAVTSGGSANTFSACLNTKTRTLTQVTKSPTKPRACAGQSTKVTWNAKGATGPRGRVGPSAPTVAYIPLFGFGSGSSAQTLGCGGKAYWAEPSPTCPASATSKWNSEQINSANFGSAATVRLQASVIVNDTEGIWPKSEMCARLWDITTQAVVGKAICATNTSEATTVYKFLSTAAVALPKGKNYYKVEVAMPLEDQGGLDNGMGGFVTQAVAIVASK
jgi:hypothetical protein